jgi:hypothetical protein
MTGALAFGGPSLLRAATDLPIADAHSHIGLYSPNLSSRSIKAEMETSGVMLLSWNIGGTDLGGMGKSAVMEQLGELRKVAGELRARHVDDKTLRAICFDNYARCLQAAMEARKA